MIARIWHGWTREENADSYESLLQQEVFKVIQQKNISGYKGIRLLRRGGAGEVEFMTIMWFASLESVKQFAGDEYETAYVPEKARKLLARFDAKSQHYEVREIIEYA